MNLRGQILIGAVLLSLLPLLLAGWIARRGVQQRFAELDTRRVTTQSQTVLADLDRRGEILARRLDGLAEGITADDRFWLAAVGGREDLRPYLLDYAGQHLEMLDLDMLQIQDATGVILSSGHFRNAFGLKEKELPRLLGLAPQGQALVAAQTPAESFLVLAQQRQVTMGDHILHLIGGLRLEPSQLSELTGDDDLNVALVWPGGALATDPDLAERLAREKDLLKLDFLLDREGYLLRSTDLAMIQDDRLTSARLLVLHDQSFLHGLLGDMNRWLGLVILLTVVVSMIFSVVFSHRISRPLRKLAARTEGLDLDRLEGDFDSNRRDEVGRLTRLLGDLTRRLRDGVSRLKEAERRATLGEMARQVNHDVRNGITPLRNVLSHLDEVCAQQPDQLAKIYGQRQGTLREGLAYLEGLAANYARLSPVHGAGACDLSGIATAALAAASTDPSVLLVDKVTRGLPPVHADPVSLRRILDNLLRNALESLPAGQGTVTLGAQLGIDPQLNEERLLVVIQDTGCGIPAADLDKIWNDFFTTKVDGTGLGLSNVRRLVADCAGTIKVTSEPGHGTTFTLSLPLHLTPQRPI